MSLLGVIALAHIVLRIGSLLVPSERRSDWLAEWKAELWQAKNRLPHRDILQFAAGSIPDAWYLRTATLPNVKQSLYKRGTASRCLMISAALASAGLLFCLITPAPRRALLTPDSTEKSTVFISAQGYQGLAVPSIRFSDYQEWQSGRKKSFSEFAFLSPIEKRVRLGSEIVQNFTILRSDLNIVDFLSLPESEKLKLRSAAEQSSQVLVSDRVWRWLSRNNGTAAHKVQIGNAEFPVVGVIPNLERLVHTNVDIVLVAGSKDSRVFRSHSTGYVLAQLRTNSAVTSSGWWTAFMLRHEGAFSQFDCISIAEVETLPRRIFFYTLLLSLLALPATTPLPLGDYSVRSQHSAKRFRRWLFLAAKLLLGFTAAATWSMAIAYSFLPVGTSASLYLQITTSFLACLFVLRWAWRDQRKRCPECLHVLSSPARVGYASQSFLAWSGTEWVCERGHGVLHVPELPTSWLSIQRWLQFDPSWRSLFSGA